MKEYIKPEIQVIRIVQQTCLLAASEIVLTDDTIIDDMSNQLVREFDTTENFDFDTNEDGLDF
jgi:hypothetical protein